MTDPDDKWLDSVVGLFVGQLSDAEVEAFERCIAKGYARRDYEGGAGFLGLARIRRV